MEHKLCKDCKYNNYPYCYGVIMNDGSYMRNDNLRPELKCGVRFYDEPDDISQMKTFNEWMREKITELEVSKDG